MAYAESPPSAPKSSLCPAPRPLRSRKRKVPLNPVGWLPTARPTHSRSLETSPHLLPETQPCVRNRDTNSARLGRLPPLALGTLILPASYAPYQDPIAHRPPVRLSF